VTVQEWIASRSPRQPAALTEQMLAILSADAHADASHTAEVCLTAAARALDQLLADNRFSRESAPELLAIDALTTYAFEHASQSAATEAQLQSFARRGAQILGQLIAQRV